MRKLFYKITFLSVFSTFVLTAAAEEDLSPNNIRSYFRAHYNSQTESMINSSSGKNIVVFCGKTGAGKSTLINYLIEKKLVRAGRGRLELAPEPENRGLDIGHGNTSCTSKPFGLQVSFNTWYWDFPGFGDTRGPLTDFFNALLMKRIIKNAKEAKFVLVTNSSEIDTERGKPFKEYVEEISRLIPEVSIEDISCLVVTKINKIYIQSLQDLQEELDERAPQTTARWREGKVQGMYAPLSSGDYDEPNQRREIITLINNTNSAKIRHLEIEHIFSERIRSQLMAIFMEEALEIAENITCRKSPLSHFKKRQLEELLSFYQHSFVNTIKAEFEQSCLVKLLREVSASDYEGINIENIVRNMQKAMIIEIDKKIEDKRKDKCIKELQKARERLEDRESDLEDERDELKQERKELKKKVEALEKKVAVLEK
jgi:septin family protein